MQGEEAIARLSALAHRTRLGAFRLLVKAGAQGIAATLIARRLKVPATTMSTHLGILVRAGLVASRREGRVVYYRLDPAGAGGLISFLVSDCCGGEPSLCGPLFAAAAQAGCAPRPKRR